MPYPLTQPRPIYTSSGLSSTHQSIPSLRNYILALVIQWERERHHIHILHDGLSAQSNGGGYRPGKEGALAEGRRRGEVWQRPWLCGLSNATALPKICESRLWSHAGVEARLPTPAVRPSYLRRCEWEAQVCHGSLRLAFLLLDY